MTGSVFFAIASTTGTSGMPSLFQAVTMVVAVFGLVLGVVNTFKLVQKDRVRLKVTFATAECRPGHWVKTGELGMKIVNLSNFPVEVTVVGRYLRKDRERLRLKNARTQNGVTLPIKLAPRASASLFFGDAEGHRRAATTDGSRDLYFVDTDCGSRHTKRLKEAPRMILEPLVSPLEAIQDL